MTHSSTEKLIDYWRERIFAGQAPLRSAIDPTDFPTLLPQVFMLGRRGPGDYVFRLAGALVGELHRLDLRGVVFTALWDQADRLKLTTALEFSRRTIEPVRFIAQGGTGPNSIGLDIVLLPLSNPEGQVDRFLGAYSPTTPIHRLRGASLNQLCVQAMGGQTPAPVPQPKDEPRIRLAAIEGRRVG